LSASIKSAQSNPKVSETEQNGSKMWPKAHLLYEQYEEMAEQSDRIPAGSIVMHGSYSNDKVGFFVRHFSRKVLACFLPIRRSLLLTLYHFSPLVAQMFAGRVSGAGAAHQGAAGAAGEGGENQGKSGNYTSNQALFVVYIALLTDCL